MIDYNIYKKFYTQGDEFILNGVEYIGYAEVINGIPVSSPGRSILNPIRGFSTDIKLSKTQYDRVFDDDLKLPNSIEDIYIQPNDYLTYELFKNRLVKMHENNSYIFSRMFMPNNNAPRRENSSFVCCEDTNSTQLSYLTSVQPLVPFRRNSQFNVLSNIKKQVVKRHNDISDIFVTFGITNTQFISISSNKNQTDITGVSTFFETENNKLEFENLTDICCNKTHAFITDQQNKYVLKYNITSYLETDPALANTKHLIEIIGDESNTKNATRFDSPTLIACSDNNVVVFDSIRNTLRVFDTDFSIVSFITKSNLKKDKLVAIEFNVHTDNLYVITESGGNFQSEEKRLRLYVYDSLFELRDDVILEEKLDDNEVVKNIMFSYNDSNTWYIVTNTKIHKKLINRPEKAVGVLQRDNMLLNTGLSFLGDKWFTYTTTITRCDSIDHIISEFTSISALEPITITESISARDESVITIAIDSQILGSIENNFEVYLNGTLIGTHDVNNKTSLFIATSSTTVSTISGQSFTDYYQTSAIGVTFFSRELIQQGDNSVALSVPIAELVEKNSGSITVDIWSRDSDDLTQGTVLSNRVFENSFERQLSSTFFVANTNFDEIDIVETTISETLNQILTAEPLSIETTTLSLSITSTNELCTSFFEVDSDFNSVLPTSNFWNFVKIPFDQANFLWNNVPITASSSTTNSIVVTPPYQYYRFIMFWDENLKNVRGGEQTTNTLNPSAFTGLINIKIDVSNSSAYRSFNGFRDIKQSILFPFNQSITSDILTQVITDTSFIKSEPILDYNIKTYIAPPLFIGRNVSVYNDIYSVFIENYNSSLGFAQSFGFNEPGWVPSVVSNFANQNNAYVEINMTDAVSLSGIRLLAKGSSNSNILPPKYVGIFGSDDGVSFMLTASAEMPNYENLTSEGVFVQADIVPQITRTLNLSFPYILTTNTTLLSTLSTQSVQISPDGASITQTQNISSINYSISGYTFEDGHFDTTRITYSVTVDENTSGEELVEDDVFVCGSIVQSDANVDDIILLTNNRISYISEPVTYTRILKDSNYSNYGIFNISLNPDEHIQHSTINKELYKVLSDLYDVSNNVVGRFSGTQSTDSFLMDLNGYNYSVDSFFPREILTDFFFKQTTDIEDSFVYENEKSIVGVINRSFETIFNLQSIIFELTRVDVGTDLLPVNEREGTLIID